MKLSFRSKKSADYIFEHLTDVQKFEAVHPVITKIDKNSNGSYLIHETLKLASIPFSFTYPATIESHASEKIVIMRATVLKMIEIEIRFELREEKDFTIIEDTIFFKSVIPVKPIMQKIFKKQHQQLFKNIEIATS